MSGSSPLRYQKYTASADFPQVFAAVAKRAIGRGLQHSTTLRAEPLRRKVRQLLDCASPLALLGALWTASRETIW